MNHAGLRKKIKYTIRLMLYYHVCRVQLEGGRDNINPQSRVLLRGVARCARVAGFRKMIELQQAGIPVRDFDDQVLSIEATRLAYDLRRGDVERAMEREGNVVEAMICETLEEIIYTPLSVPQDASLDVTA